MEDKKNDFTRINDDSESSASSDDDFDGKEDASAEVEDHASAALY